MAGPVTLSYNADHRRVRKINGGSTTNYLYDFEKVLQESDGTGTTTREYTSTDGLYGSLLSEYSGGAALYHAYDALGSTDKLLAPDGSVSNSYAYRAFGLETATPPGNGTDYSFVGRDGYVHDRDIDLYFLRRRYYDPDTGRFLSEDPLGYPAGTNLFLYVHNDPVNAIDPSGLQGQPAACAPIGAMCNIEAEVKAYTQAAQTVAGTAATFRDAWTKNADRYKSPLQSVLDGFNPVEIARHAKDCFCFLSRIKLGTIRDALACAQALGGVLVQQVLSFLKVVDPPKQIPSICWEVVYQLSLQFQVPSANAKLSEKVAWLLDSLDNPCLRAIPPARVLVDQAVQYRDSFVKVIEVVEDLWDHREEHKQKITQFITDRITALKNCFQNVWDWVKTNIDTLAKKVLKGLGLGDIAGGIIRTALCLALDSFKDGVVDAITKPVEWLMSVKEGIEEAINPIDNIKAAYDQIFQGGKEALSNFASASFSAAGAGLQAVLDGTLNIVESLGGYIYLVTISVPGIIGSLFPGPGTAAGVSLGQEINSVIAAIINGVRTVSSFISAVMGVDEMWDLIKKKIKAAEDFVALVGETLEDANDNDADEIPLVVFTEEEVNTMTTAVTSIVQAGIEAGVRLLLSLIGTAVAKVGGKFVMKFAGKLRKHAKKNAMNRCATCEKKKPKGKCFVAGTLVHSERGVVPIETVACGERVWGRDERTGGWRLAEVVETIQTEYNGDMITIEVDGERITTTGSHPFWVVEGEDLDRRPAVEELLEKGESLGEADEAMLDAQSGVMAQAKTVGITCIQGPARRGRWVAARDLRTHDLLVCRDRGTLVITAIRGHTAHLATFNLHVSEVHSYVVGRVGILVHNQSPGKRKPKSKCPISLCRKKPRKGLFTANTFVGHPDLKIYRALMKGHAIGIKARLCKANRKGGTDAASIMIPGFLPNAARNTIARGHLLGKQLGGDGHDKRNLVPICQQTTNIDMRACENKIRDEIEKGKGNVVDYEVKVTYGDPKHPDVPTVITLTARSLTSSFQLSKPIKNQPDLTLCPPTRGGVRSSC